MVAVLLWIVFGFIAGAVARLLMPGTDPGGCLVTILLGICGAVVGGLIGNYLFGVDITGLNLPSLGLAILGALVILAFVRMVRGSSYA